MVHYGRYLFCTVWLTCYMGNSGKLEILRLIIPEFFFLSSPSSISHFKASLKEKKETNTLDLAFYIACIFPLVCVIEYCKVNIRKVCYLGRIKNSGFWIFLFKSRLIFPFFPRMLLQKGEYIALASHSVVTCELSRF